MRDHSPGQEDRLRNSVVAGSQGAIVNLGNNTVQYNTSQIYREAYKTPNEHQIVFHCGIVVLGVLIGISLLLRFGFGLFIGGSSTEIESSPDVHEETGASHDERLENSIEKQSHNQTSYHYYTTIGGGIVVMILVLLIGSLILYRKLCAKNNMSLARMRSETNDVQEPMFKDHQGPLHGHLQDPHSRDSHLPQDPPPRYSSREVSHNIPSPNRYPALEYQDKLNHPLPPPPLPSSPNCISPHQSQFHITCQNDNFPAWLDTANNVQMQNLQ